MSAPEGSLVASEEQVDGTAEIQSVLITEPCVPAGRSAYSRNRAVGLDPGKQKLAWLFRNQVVP